MTRHCSRPEQPNVYLVGDILSQIYLEAEDFGADPRGFREVKHRGNIKSALWDGVIVAEVIAQKIAGRVKVEVKLDFEDDTPLAAEAAPPEHAAPPTRVLGACSLVSILASGVEANEFALERERVTTIGRRGADIVFADDSALADVHASILFEQGGFLIRGEGKDRTVLLQPSPERSLELDRGAVIRAGRQWVVVGDRHRAEVVGHFDRSGKRLATFELREGSTVVGRQAPDLTIAPEDGSLSRRHFALTLKAARVSVKDLGSANGTQVVVTAPVRLVDGDRILVGSQVLAFRDERGLRMPAQRISFDTQLGPVPAGPQPAAGPASGSRRPGEPRAPESPQTGTGRFGDWRVLRWCQPFRVVCEGSDDLRRGREGRHQDSGGLPSRFLWRGPGPDRGGRRQSECNRQCRALDARGHLLACARPVPIGLHGPSLGRRSYRAREPEIVRNRDQSYLRSDREGERRAAPDIIE